MIINLETITKNVQYNFDISITLKSAKIVKSSYFAHILRILLLLCHMLLKTEKHFGMWPNCHVVISGKKTIWCLYVAKLTESKLRKYNLSSNIESNLESFI